MAKKGKSRGRMLRRWHKWPSIVLTIFVLIFAVSGIVLNHRALFSGIDIPREYLLPEYRYVNWNNAAVRGSCPLGTDSLLIYGNIGIWITDTTFSSFSGFNRGFPEGIDNRKVSKVMRTSGGELLAGTLFGLFIYRKDLEEWSAVDIPAPDQQVVDLVEVREQVYVMTRSFLYRMVNESGQLVFKQVTFPAPLGYRHKASLFKTLWVIHSGEIAGFTGKLIVDLMGLLFIFLSVTGITYWLFPKWIKRRRVFRKSIGSLKRINRFSLKWHNKVGVWAAAFLFITTATGMFLRPPLLIAIANAKVGKIPFTLLDDPNPWYDQLRRIFYDEKAGGFIVGTNEGIYFCDPGFRSPLVPFREQPPQSVMGINVFEQTREGDYLVGSFNGLYLWNPYQGWIIDYYSPGRAVIRDPSGPPLGDHMTAGFIEAGERNVYVFDYNEGMHPFRGSRPFPEMPSGIVKGSPMSLWNLALEFHTARFYTILFGRAYILFIPLFGMFMLVILFTGFMLWWKYHRKKARYLS